MRQISASIVIAGSLVSAAIYFKPPPPAPRYAMDVPGYRLDTLTGEIDACRQDGTRCTLAAPPVESTLVEHVVGHVVDPAK